MEPQYLFILGNAPELAEEELLSVLPNRDLSPATFNLLGGTVKVAEIFSGSIAEKLTEGKNINERIIFGLSGEVNIHDTKEVKEELESLGFKARFVLPKAGENELSSVVVTKQKVSEIYAIGGIKAQTIWVQDWQDWGRRDYGRPAVDAHIGMLPPKVARMMINISGGQTILDPFCGVGTILAEALTIGKQVFGSDINPAQIAKTKKNLEWLGKTCPLQVADARKIIVPPVDAIVTEPFLGPADPKVLEQLYLDCLKHWQKILKPHGRVVIALPFVLDKTKVMGYSFVTGPFLYSRPQAKTRRHIYIFDYGPY